ncbi:MAG TPA: class I SAM-dependent methyltransferase [Xanthobacteraceae bacterium]|jgi:predicted O-methyltransferase YrrM
MGSLRPMPILMSPEIAGLLDRLFAEADRNDPAAFARFHAATDSRVQPASDRERAVLMRDIYMPVSREVGRLLYVLARSRRARTIVEFGTSLGISGIHLAAALRDNGGGRLVTTELDDIKAGRAQENFRAAGLDDLIEIRVGDAFETLQADLGGPVDLLLLDGWKELYLPMLQFLESRLAPGAVIAADDLAIAPDALASYLAYVRRPENGYVSVEVPLGDRIEISLRG